MSVFLMLSLTSDETSFATIYHACIRENRVKRLQPFFSFVNENSNENSWETFIIKRTKGEKTLLVIHKKLLIGSREANHINLIANVM